MSDQNEIGVLVNYNDRFFSVEYKETEELRGFAAFQHHFKAILEHDDELHHKTENYYPVLSYLNKRFNKKVDLGPTNKIEDGMELDLRFEPIKRTPIKQPQLGPLQHSTPLRSAPIEVVFVNVSKT